LLKRKLQAPPKFFRCGAPSSSPWPGGIEAAIGAALPTQRKDIMTASTNTPDFIVYGVIQETGKKDVLTRIGAAWRHQKGDGINLQIRALPLNFQGKMVLFPPRADDAAMGNGEPLITGEGHDQMPF
jgi:hypothetical protein